MTANNKVPGGLLNFRPHWQRSDKAADQCVNTSLFVQSCQTFFNKLSAGRAASQSVINIHGIRLKHHLTVGFHSTALR